MSTFISTQEAEPVILMYMDEKGPRAFNSNRDLAYFLHEGAAENFTVHEVISSSDGLPSHLIALCENGVYTELDFDIALAIKINENENDDDPNSIMLIRECCGEILQVPVDVLLAAKPIHDGCEMPSKLVDMLSDPLQFKDELGEILFYQLDTIDKIQCVDEKLYTQVTDLDACKAAADAVLNLNKVQSETKPRL